MQLSVAGWGVAALGLALIASPSVRASGPEAGRRVAALPLSVQGKMPEHLRASLEARILGELRHGDAEVIGPGSLPGAARGCSSAECAREVASAVEADYVLRSLVSVDATDYQIELIVLSGKNGDVIASTSESCDTCGVEEVATVAVDAATTIRRKLDGQASQPPRLAVDSRPAGAVVMLDGESLGTTPLEVEIAAGKHDIVISKAGFVRQRRRISAVEGVQESLSLSLSPTTASGSADGGAAGRRLRAGGWAAVGVGFAAIGGGIALFAADGRAIESDCSGGNIDADGDCKFRWDTTPAAVAMTVVGAAVVVTGAVLVGVGYGKKRAARAAWLDPAADGLRVRF